MMKSLERVLFLVVGGVLVLLGGAFFPQSSSVDAQNTEGVFDTIVCRKLEVIGTNGKPSIPLATDEHGGDLIIHNNAGKVVGIFGNNPNGGMLGVANNVGKNVGILGANNTSDGALGISNNKGKLMVEIGTDANGGGMRIFNNAAASVGKFGTFHTGDGLLIITDKYGNITGSMP